MTHPRHKKALRRAAPELFRLAEWVSRCPFIGGPVGTKAYIIKDVIMDDLRKTVLRLKGEGEVIP